MEEVVGAEKLNKIIEQGGLMSFAATCFVELRKFEGVPLPMPFITQSTMDAMKKWQARPDDVFVVSYTKAGTTWTQEVVSAICHDGDLEKVNKSHTIFRVPFLESPLLSSTEEIEVPPLYELVGKMKSPRTIKSHLPGHLLPPDIMQKKARIVYIARNPKDVAVSYFYFHNTNPVLPSYKCWNDFFKDFFSGNVYCGTWWDHYLYFWKRRHEPNVLFLKFEDMTQDLKSVVQRIANFLGYTFTEDVIDDITNHCTFESMKKNPMTNPDTFLKLLQVPLNASPTESGKESEHPSVPPTSFMRKGRVGDWKNHFTVAQNEAMDTLIQEKLAGSGLTFNY